MSSTRAAAEPDAHTQRRLFSASAGYCQNPSCANVLFSETPEKTFHIAEMAHVIAAQDEGPRGASSLSKEERGKFENLILLCANCHTSIDKAPEHFTFEIVSGWKKEHAKKLEGIFGVVRYETRAEARKAIERPMRSNRMVFLDYGPSSVGADNPESGKAEQWTRKVLAGIVPNNRKVLAILDANDHLLRDDELDTLEQFRQHVDDFEARHLSDFVEGGRMFPENMNTILKDES